MRVVTALWLRHLKHFWRNKIQLVFMFAMPFFFLYVFSSIFAVEGIDNPVNYMLSGIVITGVFQTSLTVATSTITDIVSGFMKEVLVSPVKRIQVAAGQILAAATVSALEAVLVLVVGFFIGLRFTSPLTPLLALLVIAASGIVFGGFGLFIATLVKNAQTYQIIEMAITMPLVFICGAYVPLSMLPRALQVVAHFNPLTYTTAFFRTVILEKWNLPVDQLIAEQLAFPVGGFVITPVVSMLITLAFGLLFLTLATAVFTRVDFSRIHRTKLADSDIWS